jgi:hypothetical protein
LKVNLVARKSRGPSLLKIVEASLAVASLVFGVVFARLHRRRGFMTAGEIFAKSKIDGG